MKLLMVIKNSMQVKLVVSYVS